MAEEPEVIRQRIDETRTSLTDKLETLENRVVGTVHEATCAVSESVDTVKDAVQQTVETVQETMQQTVSSVKQAFDLRLHIARRPWTMMAGAAALGYVGGRLIGPVGTGTGTTWKSVESPSVASSMGSAHAESGGIAAAAAERASDWAAQLGETFHEELSQLKGLALGAVFGLARDMLVRAAPPAMEKTIGELIDDVTTKLGGKPVAGPVLAGQDGDQPAPSCSAGAAGFQHRAGMGPTTANASGRGERAVS